MENARFYQARRPLRQELQACPPALLSTGISKESEAHSLIPFPSTMHNHEDSQLLWTDAQPLSSPCETGRKLTAQPGPDSWPWTDTGEIAEQSKHLCEFGFRESSPQAAFSACRLHGLT